MTSGWAIAVHGGAKEIAPWDEADNRDGLRAAIEAGRAALAGGRSAIDAVEAAVRELESRPVFNAGRGSDPTIAGTIEMCAAVMDGATLDIGGVMAIEEVCHPVSVARALLREREILLAGDGALRFARKLGAEMCGAAELRTVDPAAAVAASHDTVGAVARDAHGNLAAATSTGGLSGQLPGRVGDSPMPGCGYYAENGVGAIALSGHGEQIGRMRLASRIVDRIGASGGEAAITDAIAMMTERTGGEAGAILIDARGRIAWAHSSPHFAVAWQAEGDDAAQVALGKDKR